MIELQSNVLDEKDTKHLIKSTLDNISSVLSKTLGPYGNNSIIESIIGEHEISKDGYTVFGKLKYSSPKAETILNIIKKISRKLVTEVGDGSTSAVIVANQLYSEVEEIAKINKLSTKAMVDILRIISLELIKYIKKSSTPITEENFNRLTDIAVVSNNNDITLGTMISDLYKEIGIDGFIDLDINKKGNKSYYKINNGYEFNGGYITDLFTNTGNKINYEAINPYIFMCNDMIVESDLKELADIVGKSLSDERPLVIIAKDYDNEVTNFLKSNKIRNNDLNICPITISLGTDIDRAILEDFSIYVGGNIADKYYNNLKLKDNFKFGTCERVKITDKKSQFIGGNHVKENLDSRIKELDNKILELKGYDNPPQDRIFSLELRKSKLISKTAIIYVGGETLLEKNNKKYLVEDSIYACKSALEKGYIIGGNLIIPMILSDAEIYDDITSNVLDSGIFKNLNKETIEQIYIVQDLLDSIKESFSYGFKKVLSNLFDDSKIIVDIVDRCIKNQEIYNLLTGEYESKENTSIINSSATDIEILKASISIIGLLISSNQFISKDIVKV